MALYAVEESLSLARGDKKVSGFSGAIRSLDLLYLEEGDVLIIPEKFEVFERKFKGSDNTAQYIFCKLDGKEDVKPFYPSTFVKVREVVNENGEGTGVRKHTLGTAADLFRTFGTIEDGMNALKGKKIKVSKVEIIRSLRFGTMNVVNTQILTLDLVD